MKQTIILSIDIEVENFEETIAAVADFTSKGFEVEGVVDGDTPFQVSTAGVLLGGRD